MRTFKDFDDRVPDAETWDAPERLSLDDLAAWDGADPRGLNRRDDWESGHDD